MYVNDPYYVNSLLDMILLPGYKPDWEILDVIKAYLAEEFKTKGNIKAYKGIIKSSILRDQTLELWFFAGHDISDIFEEKKGKKPWANDLEYLEELGNRVLMTILPTNKELFNRAENVTLTLELKNVPKIFVKIYEFHSENYYRATLKPITSNINLEGLIPAYEETHDFNHPKQVKFEHTFKFP